MQLEEDRARLRDFLLRETDLGRSTASALIRQELMEERRLAGMSEVEPTEAEINEQMVKRREGLAKMVNEALTDVCKRILPEERIWDLAKQFGVFAVFLITPVGALVRSAFRDYASGDLASAGVDFCSALMLLMLLIASAVTVFRKERKN